jgi:hypothetical protein
MSLSLAITQGKGLPPTLWISHGAWKGAKPAKG